MRKNIVLWFIYSLCLSAVIPSVQSYAATITVGPGQTYTTLAAGAAAMRSGDTMIVRDGTYNERLPVLPNGSDGAYTILRAEHDGGVIITGWGGDTPMDHTSHHYQIEGIKFVSAISKEVRGNHHKFLRCAFQGGPTNNNASTVSVGTNDYNDTAYILFEDCWAFGLGGRYNWEIFNSDHIILRRCVIRHDGGWTDSKGDPEAAIAVYNSSYVELQNVIAIDSNLNYHTWGRAFYTIWNPASSGAGGIVHPTNNVNWTGAISLNNKVDCFESDGGAGSNVVSSYTDVVCWHPQAGGFGGGSTGGTTIPSITRGTFGGSQNAGQWNGAFAKWDSGTMTITNTIVTGFNGGDFGAGNLAASYNNRDGSGSCSSCNTENPRTHGLLYLPRIEQNSYLATAGSGNGQIGATIVKRIGVSRTLHGDTGYNTVTNDDLWPWPYEDRIKSDFASVAGVGARGFATGTSMDGSPQTLTNYIWEYLGNQSPFSSATMWTITSSVPNGHGTLSCNSPVIDGNATTCSASPNTGYYTSSISGCGGSWSSGNSYTTGAIRANCTVTAVFSQLATHTVTPSAGSNGSISPSTPQTVYEGSTIAFTATPNSGYYTSSFSGCGGNWSSGNSYTTDPITSNCSVIVNFARITHVVTPSAGSHGSISPTTPQTVNDGSTTTFTVTPDTGYTAVIQDRQGSCGGHLSGTTYTTNTITADCTVSATFVLGTRVPSTPTGVGIQ